MVSFAGPLAQQRFGTEDGDDMTPRIVMLGIDAGSSDLLLKWSADGTLPGLAKLRERAMIGRTMSHEGLYVGSTWPSFYTGVDPGSHGLYSRRQLAPGTYRMVDSFQGTHCGHKSFWDRLSEAGVRMAVLDVPLSSPSTGINGIQTVEYGGHDAHLGFSAVPASLETELIEQFGSPTNHPVSGRCSADPSAEGMEQFSRGLVSAVEKKTRLTTSLLKRESWDFFLQVFTESHCAGHLAWHLHDPDHRAHDADIAAQVGDPILTVYQAIDRAIDEILNGLAADTTAIVFSSHGMGPCNLPYGLARDLLVTLGHTQPIRPRNYNRRNYVGKRVLRPVLKRAIGSIPAALREHLRPLAPPIRRTVAGLAGQIDFQGSACFPVHDTPAHSGIRLNVVGREPVGVLRPGAEVDHFIDRLEKDLGGLKNADNGTPVVLHFQRTRKLYDGEFADVLPDVIVSWNQDTPVRRIYSSSFGELRCNFNHPRTGHHRPEGFFMAAGPKITPAELPAVHSIMDYAPTISEMLGVTGLEFDGRPIETLIPGRV